MVFAKPKKQWYMLYPPRDGHGSEGVVARRQERHISLGDRIGSVKYALIWQARDKASSLKQRFASKTKNTSAMFKQVTYDSVAISAASSLIFVTWIVGRLDVTRQRSLQHLKY